MQPAVPVVSGVTSPMPAPTSSPQSSMNQNASWSAQPMPGNQNPAGTSTGPNTNVHYVEDMQEVLNYPTTPNEHMYFPEKETNIIWLRETDGNGQIRNPMRRLTCEEDEVAFGPEANFVTKEQHQELYNMVAGMNNMMSDMAESIKWLKEELGGSSK